MTAPVHLGIDTGGTYTDAVLWDPGPGRVVAKAKALTTHASLKRGIAAALDAVLSRAALPASAIGLVSLSTTLATNALVEGHGAPAALVMIGLTERDVARAGLREAVGADPTLLLRGGHGSFGDEAAPLDVETLREEAPRLAGQASAFAVAAQFATRNPAHELAAKALLREETGLPVTASHELTARLDAPRRALTAFLNARLIGLLAGLIDGSAALLAARGVAAPLMVVRGDGALMSATTARERPIETILSGPAASLVGAAALTGLERCVVSDIGGTTTDIAELESGRPRRDPEGAVVGGWRTLVEAAAIRTYGLGADSIVGLDPASDALTLGPRRATPVSLLAMEHPALVAETLRRQAAGMRVEATAGRFVHLARGTRIDARASAAERALADRLADGPAALDRVATDRAARTALDRLAARGAIRLAAFTPSDAAHVLGRHSAWDTSAALAVATLFARQKTRLGEALAASAEALAERVVTALVRRSAECLVEATAGAAGLPDEGLATSPAIAAALDLQTGSHHRGLLVPAIRLAAPLVGLGAAAPTYYPAVAQALLTEVAVPEHADVANAVGAVAGLVETRREALILQPTEGSFTVALDDGLRRFSCVDEATAAARDWLGRATLADARVSGATEPVLSIAEEDSTATVEGQRMIVERRLTATATGRPASAATQMPGA
ncbi:MAG: hydantoinase/oxoprolinase family protein [Pseudomonadota bacterium]